MTFEELELDLKLIESDFNKKKKEKIIEYCKSNNPHNVGDIISNKDSTTIIKIEKITFSSGMLRLKPECVYNGARLKKDLTPYKSGEKDVIWQSNIGSKIK